jgi:ABC-type Fe3+-citrate transport system substrate-binding protein
LNVELVFILLKSVTTLSKCTGNNNTSHKVKTTIKNEAAKRGVDKQNAQVQLLNFNLNAETIKQNVAV